MVLEAVGSIVVLEAVGSIVVLEAGVSWTYALCFIGGRECAQVVGLKHT